MNNKSNDFRKSHLTEEQYRVLREKVTEAPFSGKYIGHDEDGMHHCAACAAPLFSSDTKYTSKGWNAGWPSFWDVIEQGNVQLHEDHSHGMTRTEVVCKNCGGHLGHLFDDGPRDKGGKHYCINSCALKFEEKQ